MSEKEQEIEKFCTGCGRSSLKPLGNNPKGEPYLSCCPDNNYRTIEEIGTGYMTQKEIDQGHQLVKEILGDGTEHK